MEVSAVDSLNYNQATTLNENSKLNSYANNSISAANSNGPNVATYIPTYIPSSQTLGTSPNQTITIAPSVGTTTWATDSNIEYTNLYVYDKKISEIKEYADEEINRINDNIESVVKLMKNAKEDTQAFNNLLQSLIGRKQAMVDILKIIEKENNI